MDDSGNHRRRRGAAVTALSARGGSRRGIYILPNLITSAGLLCGIFSLVQTMQGSYSKAALLIIAAGVFDALDGRVARIANATSRFGVEYDSLCDLVSFGVAPGLLIHKWALLSWGAWGSAAIGLFVMCAAIRLARFNIMVGHTDSRYFLGLPVPVAAAMLSSVVLMYRYVGRSGLPDKHIALLLLTYCLALLMVSSIRYPSFKKLQLHKAQPMSAFVGAVAMLTVAVAAYQVFLFVGAAAYVASGPVMTVRQGFLTDDSDDRGDDEDDIEDDVTALSG